MTFFERQPQLPEPFPKAADADFHVVFRHEPGLQFGQRRIGFAHNPGTKSFVIGGKFWLRAARPRTRARLPRPLPPPENFVDIGHANQEDGRSGISARSRIHCRHHPLAQVLRVSSAHRCSPRRINGERESKIFSPGNRRTDSINNEHALDFNGMHDVTIFDAAKTDLLHLPGKYGLIYSWRLLSMRCRRRFDGRRTISGILKAIIR
jgi:hypothetical protein